MESSRRVFGAGVALVVLSTMFAVPAKGIDCYQCVSTNNTHPFQCNEYLSSDIDMEPTSCDRIHGAKFCTKTVGRLEALGLNCYQCTSADEWKCADSELLMSALQPNNCDHIFEAQYCVKKIGRYGEGVGTKRACSAANLGNYCEYVRHVGDTLEYRTCVYTCDSDGCNPASTSKPNFVASIVATFLPFFLLSSRR